MLAPSVFLLHIGPNTCQAHSWFSAGGWHRNDALRYPHPNPQNPWLCCLPWQKELCRWPQVKRSGGGEMTLDHLDGGRLVAQSCPTLCNPMDCSSPGFSVHGILQARILEWSAMPFFRGFSRPKVQTQVSHIACRFFIIWATRDYLDRLSVIPRVLRRGKSREGDVRMDAEIRVMQACEPRKVSSPEKPLQNRFFPWAPQIITTVSLIVDFCHLEL